ncbi:MAG: DUF2066 domain-containing protein [Magnetococcus sp. YQC-9]
MAVVWLLVGTIVPAWSADTGSVAIYDLRGVEVSLPTGGKGIEAMHEAGVAQAQRDGLQRLFKRLLSGAEREARKEYLSTLAKDAKRLTERTVVRSTKQVGDRLNMSVDLQFSRKELSAALTKENIPYTEAAYPVVVPIAPEERGEGASTLLWKGLPNAGRDFGVQVILPLGDLEDLTQLNWEKGLKGDAEVLNWAAGRYGAGEIWLAKAVVTPVSGGKGAKVKLVASLTVARPNVAPIVYQVSEEKGGTSVEEVSNALYPAVAAKLVGQAVERWVSDHVVLPGSRHVVRMRVMHDVQVARLGEFLAGVRAVPGMAEPRVIQTTARETLFECDFQGRDELLDEALAKLVVYREKSPEGMVLWLIPPPKEGQAAQPAQSALPVQPVQPVPPPQPGQSEQPVQPVQPARDNAGKSWL